MVLIISLETLMPFAHKKEGPGAAISQLAHCYYRASLLSQIVHYNSDYFPLRRHFRSWCVLPTPLPLFAMAALQGLSSLPREKGGNQQRGFFSLVDSARGGGRKRRLIGSLKEGQNRGFVTPLMPQRWTPLLSLSRIKTLRSNLSSFFNAKRKETRVFLPLRGGKCYTRREEDVCTCFLFPFFFFFLPMIIAQFRRQIPNEDAEV